MKERQILHIDMNSFYASVELLDKPELKNKPVAVGGDVEKRHGIILAKNILAKNSGVKTAEPIWEAKKKCPDLIILPPNYEKYLFYSRKSHEMYYSYTNQVEPFGMDECWLDVTGSYGLFGSGVKIGNEIRKRIKRELGLTVSIGVSFNKVFAKFGSDYKKPDALTYISKENYKDIIWPLNVEEMIMVGPKTKKKLNKLGIYKLSDLALANPKMLKNIFGINGVKIWQWANGRDESPVKDYKFRNPIKSIGHGITCSSDLVDDFEVRRVFQQLSQKVSGRLIDSGLKALGVQIYIRDSTLSSMTLQGKLNYPSYSSLELTERAMELFKSKYRWKHNVRAVAIRAINLRDILEVYQVHFLEDVGEHEKKLRMERTVKSIRDRFGKDSITYGNLIGDLKMPDDGRDIVIMPNSFIQS
ncbi:DNA polymerase IV [Anaerosphaera multitolerans]|uniref:DNA polymerase IV n=1 Tax=Anaerosphaera multitolerans TaxID=2487351 RepID=A0A437S7S5_9FIRM|nr:DNA polymerase IV [Anaerosphaera multitolerans]RVU55032.1 DNA polymerase IV [Anaerosphaera multitolerans]